MRAGRDGPSQNHMKKPSAKGRTVEMDEMDEMAFAKSDGIKWRLPRTVYWESGLLFTCRRREEIRRSLTLMPIQAASTALTTPTTRKGVTP